MVKIHPHWTNSRVFASSSRWRLLSPPSLCVTLAPSVSFVLRSALLRFSWGLGWGLRSILDSEGQKNASRQDTHGWCVFFMEMNWTDQVCSHHLPQETWPPSKPLPLSLLGPRGLQETLHNICEIHTWTLSHSGWLQSVEYDRKWLIKKVSPRPAYQNNYFPLY